ncbi:filamentous hemagglutinin N-terminal domain-containing protein, partial [Comamonas odontotermitis]|uniref:two-partner secretion domain-containing protein n=1 Tax=Comamonas odontotermitis TaxID=379895 RepID=UPI00375343FF
MLFTHKAKRRITKSILTVYFCGQAGIGVFSPAFAQGAPQGIPQGVPIADPRAPLAFQPSIQNVPGAASVVNITAPNAAGLSLNQYQSFDVPTSGVVLNNSQIGGTPLLGGKVPANPNLAGGTANTIVNEVTTQGPPSQINGTIEVFGNPAAVIVANPSGITCNGCGVVNTPRLSFSTGSITLRDVNGAASSFGLASGIGYNVQGGQIAIQGTGVEGTVGQIDLVGDLLRIDGPLRAHYLNQGVSSINLMAGKTPGAGAPSMGAGATNSAAGSTSGSSVAIDASALGAMTAGRITVVSTDAGMGVNLRGPLLAYQQDVDIQSAGRVTTGDVAASRDIRINADGLVITGGTVAANDNLKINGKDGVYLAGTTSAQKGITLGSTQGSVTAQGPLATAGNLDVQAAQAVRIGSPQSAEGGGTQVAGTTTLRGDTVSISGKFVGGKDVNINAASGAGIVGDATIAGNLSMQSGGDAALFGNIQVNQNASVSGRNVSTSGALTVGQSMDILGVETVDLMGSTTVGNQLGVSGGQVTLAGNLDAGQTTVSAQQLNLGGTDGNLNVNGSINLNASQSFNNTGNVNVTGSFDLTTGGDAQFGGTVTTGSNFGVNAGGNITLGNTVNSGGSVNLNAGSNLQVNNTITAGGGVNGTAGGNISVNEQ